MADNGFKTYTDADMVRVVDGNGQLLPDPAPKAWLGTDLLPQGSKQATDAQVKKAEDDAKAAAAARASAG